MTLFRGNREIQIRFLGRGHTAGDVVVFLPNEKIVITGDFLTSGLSNMSDSFPEEWVASLDALKKLDFDTVLPGHGDAFTDKAKIDYFQAYLRDVWSEVSRLKKQGVSAEEAAKRADLTKHKDHLPIQGPGVPPIAATRIYDLTRRKTLTRRRDLTVRREPRASLLGGDVPSAPAQRSSADRDGDRSRERFTAHRVRHERVLDLNHQMSGLHHHVVDNGRSLRDRAPAAGVTISCSA